LLKNNASDCCKHFQIAEEVENKHVIFTEELSTAGPSAFVDSKFMEDFAILSPILVERISTEKLLKRQYNNSIKI